MPDKPETTKCWCLICDPVSGEIGLECTRHPQNKENTPTSWELHEDNTSIVVFEHGSACCLGKDKIANAALIVRAVNRDHLFDEMVECFSPLKSTATDHLNIHVAFSILEKARAILAKLAKIEKVKS